MEDLGLKPSSSESGASVCSCTDITAGVQPRAGLHISVSPVGNGSCWAGKGLGQSWDEGHLPWKAAGLMVQQRGGKRVGRRDQGLWWLCSAMVGGRGRWS